MKSRSAFLLHFLAAMLVTLSLCVALHLIADPYAIFGTQKIEGFNKVKAVIGSKQRVFETVELLRREPEVVIFGTSRTDIGIDPQHKAFKGMSSFNAAASGEHIGEVRELLEALIAGAKLPPKYVVIGLDFMAFNALAPDPFDYAPENFSPWRRVQLLFSISTTLDSLRTLQRQEYQYQLGLGGLLRDDGFREYVGNPAMKRHEQFAGSEEGFLRNNYNAPPHCRWSMVDESRGRDYLDAYRQILRMAHEHGVQLKLFISPSHARQWETLAIAGLWPEFEGWKRDLVRINREEAKRAGKPMFLLVDFSGYNAITTEEVNDKPDMKHYWESSHYRKETGDKVLNRLFNVAPITPDFGEAMTPQSIETWLQITREARREYMAEHPSDINEIKSISAKVNATSPCAARSLDQRPVSH